MRLRQPLAWPLCSESPSLQGDLLTLVVTSELEPAQGCVAVSPGLPVLSQGSAAWQEITAPEPAPAPQGPGQSLSLPPLILNNQTRHATARTQYLGKMLNGEVWKENS